MIQVSLIAKTDKNPTELISHSAKTCYTATVPEFGKLIDVENNLFKTGHHTTLQHSYFTFNIDGVSISAITFGLHLTSPFYNTDQRSGRFSKMYNNSNFEEIKEYILKYWSSCDIDNVLSFIKNGIEIYQKNIEKATEIAEKFIKEERPNTNEEYIKMQAPKIAQEQLRMFISTIAPTALDYTVNLSTLTALWRGAWSPEMREITEQMKNLVLTEFPELSYMFDDKTRRSDNWVPEMDFSNIDILATPRIFDLETNFSNNLNLEINTKDSVDLRYFTPEKMENSISTIKYGINISIATMGQDQRHRTIKRSVPKLIGKFYLPPILKELNLEEEAKNYLNSYKKLFEKIDKSLLLALAPYGMMVEYKKIGDLNAVIHEQEKRLCWSAQEEIYNLSRQVYKNLTSENSSNDMKKIAKLMLPACYKKACIEGRRYCGRDILKVKKSEEVPYRKI